MGKIRLKDIDTRAPRHLDKQDTKQKLAEILQELDDLQNLLYAEAKHAILIVIQGMDASGKDGPVRNVFGKLNPQGIQLFNRSQYEDVVVTRVHKWIDDKTAFSRMKAINHFEWLLENHGKGYAKGAEDAISRT